MRSSTRKQLVANLVATRDPVNGRQRTLQDGHPWASMSRSVSPYPGKTRLSRSASVDLVGFTFCSLIRDLVYKIFGLVSSMLDLISCISDFDFSLDLRNLGVAWSAARGRIGLIGTRDCPCSTTF